MQEIVPFSVKTAPTTRVEEVIAMDHGEIDDLALKLLQHNLRDAELHRSVHNVRDRAHLLLQSHHLVII